MYEGPAFKAVRRWKLAAAAAELNGVPSEKRTPDRSVKV